MPLYFIAIVAPNEIHDQVLEWKMYMLKQFGCKVSLRSPAHITLVPPFNLDAAAEPSILEILYPFAREQQPFTIDIRNFDSFPPRVIYARVEPQQALARLKHDLEAWILETKQFVIKKDHRSFHPHITIANRDLKKEDFAAAWKYFAAREYEASFSVHSISLLRNASHKWEIAAHCPFRS